MIPDNLFDNFLKDAFHWENDDLDTMEEYSAKMSDRITKVANFLNLADYNVGKSVIDVWEVFCKKVSEAYKTHAYFHTKVSGYQYNDRDLRNGLGDDILKLLLSIKDPNVQDFSMFQSQLDNLRLKYIDTIKGSNILDRAYGYAVIYELLVKGYQGYKLVLKRAQTTGENPGGIGEGRL